MPSLAASRRWRLHWRTDESTDGDSSSSRGSCGCWWEWWPGITAYAFLFLLAAWAIMTGILELIALLAFPMSGGRGALMVLTGLDSIVFGILIAIQPAAGLLTVIGLIGLYAIVIGILHLVAYFEADSVSQTLSHA